MRADRLAGALSLGAALVHGGLTTAHFEEWWAYGVFFLAVTSAQALLGLALLLDAFPAARQVRQLRLGGICGNVAVALTYLVSRTLGIPLLGPAAGAAEPLDPLGVMTVAAEVAIAFLLAYEVRGARRPVATAR